MSPAPSRTARARGMALVIVLAFLALLSILILAFFSSVQTELQAARANSASTTVKQLAETAQHIVLSQIADGTRGYEIPALTPTQQDSGKRLAWISQPGLIRTYDDLGAPGRVYKLYTSSNMVVPPGNDYSATVALNGEVPTSWPGQTAIFTDLNQPVLVLDTAGTVRVGNKTYTANYPIVDPTGLLTNDAKLKIEGFSIAKQPGYVSGSNPSVRGSTGSGNYAPMPVRWMYVLADGTLTMPDSGTTVAAWSTAAAGTKPSKVNPIVGRVAFWTDDETCKLNVNTASEGVFWDRPWATGNYENNLANNIPRQGEYNRYCGHPSLTSLSAVFGSLYPVTIPIGAPVPPPAKLMPYLGKGATYPGTGIAPRTNIATDVTTSTTNPFGFVNPKNERLYASVEEIAFKPTFGSSRDPFDSGNVGRPFLETAKFFLTASSRAPELNLFGQPRVGLWPLQLAAGDRNAKDKLIAFCGTTAPGDPLNEHRYYFQRFSKYTGEGRLTQTDPAPSSQDPLLDWTRVQRNQEIFKYLQRLTGTAVPGYGGNFLAKYNQDRDQILTEMFDYLRSGVNSYSDSLTPVYDFLPSRSGYPKPGETQAIPLRIPDFDTMGFGRFSTITQAGIDFFYTEIPGSGGTATPVPKIQAFLMLEQFTPVIGPASWSPHVRYVVKGLDNFLVNTKNLGFPAYNAGTAMPRNLVTSRVGYSGGGHTTAFMGLQSNFYYFNPAGGTDFAKVAGVTNEETNYPFVSQKIDVPPGETFDFSGGDIEIQIYSGYDKNAWNNGPISSDKLIQTIRMNFPPLKGLPIPKKQPAGTAPDFTDIKTRLTATFANIIPKFNGSTDFDVVRGVMARADGGTHGDLRLQTALPIVEANYFVPHPNYNTVSLFQAHSLRTSDGSGPVYLSGGQPMTNGVGQLQTRLVSNLAYPLTREPAAARGLGSATTRTGLAGDWDNGVGAIEDGAYINKADEGNMSTDVGAGSGYMSRGSFTVDAGQTYSPTRQIASAVNFGSLPTGLKRTRLQMQSAADGGTASGYPWQTLLFCRYPAAGDAHPGRVTPRDHLFLDLFTMPVIEPYAISEPFSTAGKVNMNYQIAPFTYITRSTAMRGVLKASKVTAIPNIAAANYKTSGGDYRQVLNIDETLKAFENRFVLPSPPGRYAPDTSMFRSPSEICDMYLVPATELLPTMATFWKTNGLTGDNAREYPYGQLYPRLTTRSNSFTVHMRVQVLKKVPNTPVDTWDETRDVVLSEYRGSAGLERYVDPSDPDLPDFAVTPSASMDKFYKFRVTGTKKFAP